MGIKLFVTDLDGTLLNNNNVVSDKNISAIKEAIAAGVIVTFATGRMYSSALKYAQQINIDVPIITYNGALIKSTSSKIYHEDFIEPDVVTELVNYCAPKGWYLLVASNDEVYFPDYSQRAVNYEKTAGLKGFPVGWDNLSQKTENVGKMLFVTENFCQNKLILPSLEDSIIEEISHKFADKLNFVKSKQGLIEVIKPTVSKANALQILAKHFNIPIAEVMAIGDANNDLPMLHAAGKSVAMGNAADDIKAVCDYTVSSNEDDGVAEAIYTYILN